VILKIEQVTRTVEAIVATQRQSGAPTLHLYKTGIELM